MRQRFVLTGRRTPTRIESSVPARVYVELLPCAPVEYTARFSPTLSGSATVLTASPMVADSWAENADSESAATAVISASLADSAVARASIMSCAHVGTFGPDVGGVICGKSAYSTDSTSGTSTQNFTSGVDSPR